jgi:hypothetical protein
VPGISEIALAGAPIAGGALLGLVAGNLRPPDVRTSIKADLELLKLLPPEETQRRAALQRTVDMRIDDLVAGIDRGREIRQLATSYQGNWRDIVVFICAVLFTIVWWNVSHARSNWLVMFVLLIIVSVVAAIYAGRGTVRALKNVTRRRESGVSGAPPRGRP